MTRLVASYQPLHTFDLPHGQDKHYKQQYGDMYFLRLSKLRQAVEKAAEEAWSDFEIAGEKVQRKSRVLDVRQGELCWVAGTVYMHMPSKPNILVDILNDNWISAPAARGKYISSTGQDETMLEDESGRLQLVGLPLETSLLVTGCIIAVMGTENLNGDFEIIDLKFAELPPQPNRAQHVESNSMSEARGSGKVAIVSGLAITGDDADSLRLDILMEYLLGEAGGEEDQSESAKVSRLIIAGNSIGAATVQSKEDVEKKVAKKYGYDASAYNPAPTTQLDAFLSTLLPSIPITLLPGESDPANVSLPQQPLHPAMLPYSRAYAALPSALTPGSFDSVTNPWQGDVGGWRFLGNGGQPVDDISRYAEGDDRLEMMEHLLRWRCGAPTAPDTLCMLETFCPLAWPSLYLC